MKWYPQSIDEGDMGYGHEARTRLCAETPNYTECFSESRHCGVQARTRYFIFNGEGLK